MLASASRLTAALTLGVTACTLAGCTTSDTAQPSFSLPPVTATARVAKPSPTPAADPATEPTRPAILDAKPSKQAAIAFAEYFLALYDYAYKTGDDKSLRTTVEPTCLFCKHVLKDLAAERAAGQHTVGGGFQTLTQAALRLRSDFFTATLQVVQAPSSTVDAKGAVVESTATATRYLIQFALNYSSGKWTVEEVSAQATSASK